MMKTIKSATQAFPVATKRFSGEQLAELLGVTPAALSDAIKNDRNCCGYPIGDFAERYRNGRVKAYHVPASLLGEMREQANSQK